MLNEYKGWKIEHVEGDRLVAEKGNSSIDALAKDYDALVKLIDFLEKEETK